MVIKVIKNFENVNFRGVEIPKCEKKLVENFQISGKFGDGEFPPHPKIKISTPNWGCGWKLFPDLVMLS